MSKAFDTIKRRTLFEYFKERLEPDDITSHTSTFK